MGKPADLPRRRFRVGVLYRHVDVNTAHRWVGGSAPAAAIQTGRLRRSSRRSSTAPIGGQGCRYRLARHRSDGAGRWSREPLGCRGRNNVDGSRIGELRPSDLGHPTSVTITLSNPTGSDQTFSVSVTKFTPDTFGGTVPSIWNAGTFSAGDDRITVPASVMVPANGSTTMTVTVSAPQGASVQGWINLDGPGSQRPALRVLRSSRPVGHS